MVQIRLDTDYAREVGQRFKAESDHLEQIGRELQNAIGSLDTWAWDGVSRWRAEPLLDRVRPESAHIAHELDELGYRLERVANILEHTDATVVDPIAQGVFDSDWLPGVPEPWDLGAIIGIVIGRIDDITRRFFDHLLPEDLSGDEYITFQVEEGVVVPLAELGLPFSGYLSGEEGITIMRNDDGTYSVIIGRAGGIGADFSHGKVVGSQVGLRGEQGYEFAFNPEAPGDLSKMALLLTTLGASKMLSTFGLPLGQVTENVTMSDLKDNMISMSGGIGVEGQVGFDLGPMGELDIEGTAMIGAEMRRESLDQPWEAIVSRKLTGEIEGKLPALDALQSKGELGFEFTFNDITNTQTGQRSSEVVLQIQASAGNELSLDAIASALPADAELSLDSTGQLEITYRLDSPVESAMDIVREGNFDSIIENSSIEVEVTVGSEMTTTVGGELELGFFGQSIGGEFETEISSGREVSVQI